MLLNPMNKIYPWQLAAIRKAWVAQVTLPFVISAALWGVVIDWIDYMEDRRGRLELTNGLVRWFLCDWYRDAILDNPF